MCVEYRGGDGGSKRAVLECAHLFRPQPSQQFKRAFLFPRPMIHGRHHQLLDHLVVEGRRVELLDTQHRFVRLPARKVLLNQLGHGYL